MTEGKAIKVYVGPESLSEDHTVISPEGIHQEPWMEIVCQMCGSIGQVPARMKEEIEEGIPICPRCIEMYDTLEETGMALPAVFRDLPIEAFPFTISFFDVNTKEIYLEQVIDGPGAIHVPPKPEHVERAGVRISFPDGTEEVFE